MGPQGFLYNGEFDPFHYHPWLVEEIVVALQHSLELQIVFTDIDNTLVIGTGATVELQRQGALDTAQLIEYVQKTRCILIPVTGASWDRDAKYTESVSARIAQGVIPSYFHAIVTDGGSAAFGRGLDGGVLTDHHYHRSRASLQQGIVHAEVRLRASSLVEQICLERVSFPLAPLGWDKIEELEPTTTRERMVFQPECDREGRVSLYFFASSLDERDAIEALLQDEFRDLKVVVCEERDFNNAFTHRFPLDHTRKYCADLGLDKSVAVEYFATLITALVRQLDPAATVSTWYCGDAGNDLSAARSPVIDHVCMVGGASIELTRHEAELGRAGKRVYVERGDRRGPASILWALSQWNRS
jgi:hypothetical protein